MASAERHARKHGGAKRRPWRKIHIGVDEHTLEIRALEITGSNVGDASFVGKTMLLMFDAEKAMLFRAHLIPDRFLILLIARVAGSDPGGRRDRIGHRGRRL